MRVVWHDARAKLMAQEGGTAGVEEAGEALKERADDLAPLEFGTLIGTAAVTTESVDGVDRAVVSYGTAYARALHAHPEWDFQNGRQAHWLETAQAETDDAALATLGGALHERLR